MDKTVKETIAEMVDTEVLIFKIIRLIVIGFVVIMLGFSGCAVHRNAQLAKILSHGGDPIAIGQAFKSPY